MNTEDTIEHMDGIRDRMCLLLSEVDSGAIELNKANILANVAGKIVATQKVQLAYHALRGEVPDMPFLAASTMSAVAMTEAALGAPIDDVLRETSPEPKSARR